MKDGSITREKFQSSFRKRILPFLVYVIAAILLIITGFLTYRETKRVTFSETTDRLETLNRIKQDEINQWFNERHKDVAFYQSNRLFVNEVFHFLGDKKKDTGKLTEWLKQTYKSHGYDIFIVTSDSNLHYIIGYDSTRLSPHIIDACFQAIKDGKSKFLDIYRRENTSKLFYASMALLKRQDNKSPEACLVFRSNVSDKLMYELISDKSYVQNVGYSLVRNEGDSIFFINNSKYNKLDGIFPVKDANISDSPYINALKGKPGVFTGPDYNGKEILASVRNIPGSQWWLVVHTDINEIENRLSQRKLIIISYILLVLFIFVMWHSRYVQKERAKNLREELRLNNELNNNREMLETIIDSSPLPIIVTSKNNTLFIWNRAATLVFGLTPEEVIAMGNPIIGNGHSDQFQEIKKAVSGPVKRFNYETRFQKKDGQIILLRVWVSEVQDPVSKDKNLLFICDDITERRNTADELRLLNEELEKRVSDRTIEVAELNQSLTDRANQLEILNSELESFTYSVSHDLKAPLRSIHGFTDIVLQEHSDGLSEEVLRLLGVVKKNARRMDQLISDLLDLSRVTRITIKMRTLDMEEIIAGIISDEFANIHETTNITIHPLAKAEGDPVLIQQLWRNLISNAVKYTRKVKNPEIEISCKIEPGKIIYFIRDNGAGFNQDYADKLFNTFQRLHSNDQFEGTGVGLAIVKRIIMRHNGEVWGEGEEGKGATFYFSLPEHSEH